MVDQIPAAAPDRGAGTVGPRNAGVALVRNISVAGIAATMLPRRSWFRFALAASRWQGRVARLAGRDGKLTETAMMVHWLYQFSLHGNFPIPSRVHGRDVLDRYAPAGPVFYCTLHSAVGDLPLRGLAENGYPVPSVVSGASGIEMGGQYAIRGTDWWCPALPADGYVLARMRSVFQRGGHVACMMDGDFGGGPFFPNPLRLAGRMGVPAVLTWATIAPDGVVDIWFREAPRPLCSDEEAVAENLRMLHAIRDAGGVEPAGGFRIERAVEGQGPRLSAAEDVVDAACRGGRPA